MTTYTENWNNKKMLAEGTLLAIRFNVACSSFNAHAITTGTKEFERLFYADMSEELKIEWIEATLDLKWCADNDPDDIQEFWCLECGAHITDKGGCLCDNCRRLNQELLSIDACLNCEGSGEVELIDRHSFFDPIKVEKCPSCDGTGKRC